MFLYNIKDDNTVSIYRAYGKNGVVIVPDMIDGRKVTEIEKYCFASKTEYEIDESGIANEFHVQAGRFIEKIVLPKTITSIGKSAFYNCINLRCIDLPGGICETGGDMFMNCNSLSRIIFREGLDRKNCLKQILSQISWNVEVRFISDKIDAIVYYPEYFEGYDEIGPAHIFELNISGEGFRTRQCFENGFFKFDEYDSIFIQACAEEPIINLVIMAMNRIVYPYGLAEEYKTIYSDYLKKHSDVITNYLFDENQNDNFSNERMLYYVRKLSENGCFRSDDMNKMIERASDDGNTEISVNLMKIKSEFFKVNIKNRYSFEDF